MTKTIKLIKNGNEYEFWNERILFSVDTSKKQINGKDIFEKIYFDANSKDPVKIIIDQSQLPEEDKRVFGNYVVDLFEELDKGINTQFASPTPVENGNGPETK